MGSDISVVLHPDAPVPDVVLRTQQKARHAPPSQSTYAVVERSPAIRVLEATAAKSMAGDLSAASMTSSTDYGPVDQPVLLIRNCADLASFTKSRTYVPVLRAIHMYLNQHGHDASASCATGGRSHPVCPMGLIFDPSLAVGDRLSSSESRAACVQCIKLFLAHLIAALEFVREPDGAGRTHWNRSSGSPALREGSTGAMPVALAPRLSILYLDLRRCSLDDATAKWFAVTVILRAVRRARPFTLVSTRGGAAGVAAATSAGGGGGGNFLNYYSPDVKADMVWASLQHVLLTENRRLTQDGAKAVLEELLAEDATRRVLLQQQGLDPMELRAQQVAQALAGDRLSPHPDSQLLPHLYFVDVPRRPHGNGAQTAAEARGQVGGPSPLRHTVTNQPEKGEVAASAQAPAAAAARPCPNTPRERPVQVERQQPAAPKHMATPAPQPSILAKAAALSPVSGESKEVHMPEVLPGSSPSHSPDTHAILTSQASAAHKNAQQSPAAIEAPAARTTEPKASAAAPSAPAQPQREGRKQQQLQRPRAPSPSSNRRLQLAVALAEKLDDVPDVVVKGHSARRPPGQSPRPDVGYAAPTSTRKSCKKRGAAARIPAPASQQCFLSAVWPSSSEPDEVRADLEKWRCPDDSPLPSSGQRPSSLYHDVGTAEGYEEVEERMAAAKGAWQGQPAQDGAPWAYYTQPIGHHSTHPAGDAVRAARQRDPLDVKSSIAARRSARTRRNVYIPELHLHGSQSFVAASHVSPRTQKEGLYRRHESQVQVVAARRGGGRPFSNPTTPGRSRTPRGSSACGSLNPRTAVQRSQDSVAVAKAAYEAATLAEARAKAKIELRAQKQQRQQQREREAERGASPCEGEVGAVDEEGPVSPPVGCGGSPSPAPDRPQGVNSPFSFHTPLAKDRDPVNLRSVYAKRRLSTAEPPHIVPRFTTTSQLRKVTSQRCRRASEVEAGINGFHANNAIPRRDFRGAAAMASMALCQPTHDELVVVQVERQLASSRRPSLGANSARNKHNLYDARRASAAEMSGYEAYSASQDVSSPPMKAQVRSPSKTSASMTHQASPSQQQRWTPAYHHGRRSERERDGVDDCETSSGPSLSPWGTADYQGSMARYEEGNQLSPGGEAVEVNEYGVELVHKVLRTKLRTRYGG
ncbi:hypothetical protein ABL78_8180 [Leptomonas seymouri]|uniref:Uncharacterized protein n=1 Tax=Leptomonas seymouri TaxID=5684 RepID=A0A0N1PAU3_LEPSE|nr:hypothetical protein ABL78_8180 [Leptomonas seymouri]|eukprot:KPI82808.1 hypothetical protein ABL78_8180 [Leptomonas seymouri]